ncbi:AMP-binding protein, partial [Mycobacterium sp. 1274756.6]|uniref:AMP-binding protein n=1 Tax=Mycobacterium sp. 1274756.6 TaxID=1834076 RepID=UPI0012E768FE
MTHGENEISEGSATEVGDQLLPLTRSQLDIWLSQQTGLVGTEWQLGLLGKVDGPIKPDLLESAIRHTLDEAEAGRAVVIEEAGRVGQRPFDYSNFELDLYDLTDSEDPAGTARELASLIQRDPMSLSGPLAKFVLFQTGISEYYLFGLCHHIAVDGLSMAMVSRRIAAVYTALVSGKPAAPSSFGSLRDLVRYETEYEQSADYEEDLDYWRNNIPQDSGLDGQMLSVGNHDAYSTSATVQLKVGVVKGIGELNKSLRIRRYSVITAACALMVRSWSRNSSEVALDFPVSRRVGQLSRTIPGMLAGVVPLVLKTSPTATIAEFCRYVDVRIRELLQHQRFPVRTLETGEEGLSGIGAATNRVAVNFIPGRLTLDLAGTPVTASYTNHGPLGHFGFFFLGAGDELLLSTAGAGQPFAGLGVADLGERLQRILTIMAANPDALLSSIDTLLGDEDASLDEFGNRTALTTAPSVWKSIPGLFAEQVVAGPDVVALRFEGRSWTYRQVDEASNRLAHLLVGRGVGPGGRVGLVLPRSADAVIAILAVLKTGAGYVPVDPMVPDERVRFVFDDAAPTVVLADAEQAQRLTGMGVSAAVIDVEDPVIADQPATALASGPTADDIAYVIYTSGTTGVPKGVAVAHSSVVAMCKEISVGVGLGPEQVWSQWHSLTFDVSVWEVWGALLHGGRLVVVPEQVRHSAQDLQELLVAEQVTVLSQTPSAVAVLSPQGLELMALIVAGEACPPELVDRWAPGRVMVNAYGPTEATIYASVSAPLSPGSSVVPIGSPVPGAALFV